MYILHLDILNVTENTGNILPRYSNLTDNYINCPLENINITNPDFLIWLIFLFISILIITYIIRKYGKNKLVLLIILLLNLKSGGSLYTMSILLPLSVYEIDFRDSFYWKFYSSRFKSKISYFKIQTLTQDIISLLNSLEDDVNYSMSYSLISSYKEWNKCKGKNPPLFIDNPIIVNKESDPILITQFIMNRLDDEGLFFIKWLFSSINTMDSVILTVTVPIDLEI